MFKIKLDQYSKERYNLYFSDELVSNAFKIKSKVRFDSITECFFDMKKI